MFYKTKRFFWAGWEEEGVGCVLGNLEDVYVFYRVYNASSLLHYGVQCILGLSSMSDGIQDLE